MKNIVLIGMPGAGKSTIGVILAKIKGMNFVDTDLVIQNKENRLLSEIIESEGPEGFLKIEEEINANLQVKNSVIATGGSVVYGAKAMEHLKSVSTIVYLKLSYESVNARLSNIKGRGVVLREGQTLEDLYRERIVLYEKYADLTIEEENLNVEETIEKTLQELSLLLK